MATALIGRAEARIPPHDLEAETSVLGAILLDQAAITRVLDFLHPEDFYRENNGHIYRAGQNLFREGEPIDNVTLAAELEKLGLLERVGGRAHLAMLQESVPTAANVEYYARIVKDRAYKRRLITAGAQVTSLGYEDALDAEEAVNQAQSQVYAISEERVGSGMERLYDLLKPAMDRIDAQMASGGGVLGIASGFHDLDRMTNGYKASDLIVIAGRPSMGKCLTASTLVDDPLTGDRLTIEDAVRRRLPTVWGMAEGGSIRPARVSAWIDSGVQHAYGVRTRTGRTVEVTGHHPFLTLDGWQPLHDLLVGDRIAVPRRVPSFGSDTSLPVDRVRALGDLVADRQPERLPGCVWRWDGSRLTELIRVLMSRHGTIHQIRGRSRIQTTVAPRGLAADVQHALTRLGIVSKLWHKTARTWQIEISEPASVAEYQAEIGWVGDEPRRPSDVRLSDWRSNADYPPGAVAPQLQVVAPGGGARTSTLASPLEDHHLKPTAHPHLYWDEIASIEPIGRQQVYDLTVPDGSNFIAQDVIVHNTSFVLNVALHAAVEQKKPVAVFSLEMSKEQLVERMLCEQARIDAQRLHRGLLSDVEYERLAGALGPLGDAPIFIDDAPTLDDLTLRLKSRQARTREGIEMIVLDYLQLMHGRSRNDDGNRVQEVSAISRGLKSIARELKVPVLAISQLSRAPEARPDKRPILSDLRESGCMPASTRLLRADTGQAVTLGELAMSQEQPLVWSLDESWRLVPRRLTRTFASGIKRVYRLRLASGSEVQATANHPFRTVEAWQRLDQLHPGDRVAVPCRLPPPAEQQTWSEDELILLAHIVGGGSIGPAGITYATCDPANRQVVEDAARRRFGIEVRGVKVDDTWQLGVPAPVQLTAGRRHPIRSWLEPLGMWGAPADSRFIPEFVHSLADDQIALFLHHLWAVDGSLTIGRDRRSRFVTTSYASTSRTLVEGVRRLLLRLDIRSRLTWGGKAGDSGRWGVYLTAPEDSLRFLTTAGCNGARRAIAAEAVGILTALEPDPNLGLVPTAVGRSPQALQVPGITDRAAARQLGEPSSGSTLLGSHVRPGRFSKDRLPAAIECVGGDGFAALGASDVFWDEVVEISVVGDMPTFDATVDGTHNFVADGVIAHNSIEQDADIVMFLYRDDYYHREKSEKPGIAEVIVAKHRNGPTGTVELVFRKELTRFENLDRRRADATPAGV